jgi:cellulose synthase/poly-beta-1,6-N-acetylglucosamine synthase-like glycosyltransferase
MIIASVLLTLFYLSLIGAYCLAWMRIPYFNSKPNSHKITYSILIPARNEAHSIETCLEDIVKQQIQQIPFEILVIDDCSTDQTANVVRMFIQNHPNASIRLLSTDSYGAHGKKASISYAVTQADGAYLIMTDADCRRGPNWLGSIHSFITETKSKLVYAPVVFRANTLFEKLQSLEFAGLVAIGGAAIELKNPNMCSGSNLIVEKQTFIEVDGYSGSEHIATGDDEYLLHKVSKVYPQLIHFLKSRDAIVTTDANQSLGELASQRKRWVSASTKYENVYITAILIAAYLFNAAIVYQLFASPYLGWGMLGAKTLFEGVFLYHVLSFFNRKQYILLLPLAEPFHIIYVLFIGLWANIGTYNWKGRDVK